MPAIVTDQFRILNANNFVESVEADQNSYYVFIGLSTFPTIQRRYFGGLNAEFGLRNTGSIRIVSGL